ncbi:MAG: endonuclease/exonuclease/phosphatase family protein [Microbacterium sp.]
MTGETLLGWIEPDDIHVMTFNIRRPVRRSLRRADAWGVRRERVRGMLAREQPTILGVQEALPSQARVVAEALGARYRRVGHGRGADGGGEGCPLFFDAERLALIAWEQAALSSTPSVPGSRSWGNVLPRIVVSARFVDRRTGARFRVLNTHLDHLSRRSRERSADAIRRTVLEEDEPVILLGDLNARLESTAVRVLLDDDVLRDAWRIAGRRVTPEWSTFADYRHPRVGAGRIDWILTTSGIRVLRMGINPHRFDGGWPSDHLPVQAVVRVEPSGDRS